MRVKSDLGAVESSEKMTSVLKLIWVSIKYLMLKLKFRTLTPFDANTKQIKALLHPVHCVVALAQTGSIIKPSFFITP